MYADRVASGSKRSIKDRLNGNVDEDIGRSWPANSKRQRQTDDKWKHDLYDDDREPQTSKPGVGPKDLRLKLQKKGSEQAYRGGKDSGVRDLREKLSGTMHLQPQNIGLPKAKPVMESAKPVKKSVPSVEAPVPETKKISNPTSSRNNSQQKAEEVDMTALMHMSDEDLKALGIPMGPRKKILLALESRP